MTKLAACVLPEEFRSRESLSAGVRDGVSTFDYRATCRLTRDDIPRLIELAEQWAAVTTDGFADGEDFRPIHAWRALGQLRAAEAVRPLLELSNALDRDGDDWFLEELPPIFGRIGAAAIPDLAEFLADRTRSHFARCTAMHGLREIARQDPACRDRVIGILAGELDRHAQNDGEVYGTLVSDLIELEAVEAAESIERAFAANVVDPVYCGHWRAVREELGVPGLGLAPDESPGWTPLWKRMGLPDPKSVELRFPTIVRVDSGDAFRDGQRQKLRAKRKRERRNKKRNRRRR